MHIFCVINTSLYTFLWKLFDMFDALCQNLPRLKFNKEGNLLAVSTADGGFKVLANADGIKFLRNIEASKEPFFTKVCIWCNSPSSCSASLTKIMLVVSMLC